MKIAILRDAIIEMHTFLINDCYELDASLTAKQYLMRLNKSCSDRTVDDVKLVNLAKDHQAFFKIDQIFEADIIIDVLPATET